MAILDTVKATFDLFPRRFFFNALLPTSVFTTILTVVASHSFSRFGAILNAWTKYDVLTQLGLTALYLAAIWFLAAATASQWRGIVRIFEGYPLKRVMKGRSIGLSWHRRRQHFIHHVKPSKSSAYYFYPTEERPEDLLPTGLGNILRAAEGYPLDRYGIDSIVFWPRLYPLLPEEYKKDYEEFVMNYEFPLVLSFQSFICALLGSAMLILTHQSPYLFLAYWLSFCVVAVTAYYLSLSSALEMGEQQRTAYDLYRAKLLELWPTVEDVEDEGEAFAQIERFVVGNAPPTWGSAQARHQSRRTNTSDSSSDPRAT